MKQFLGILFFAGTVWGSEEIAHILCGAVEEEASCDSGIV